MMRRSALFLLLSLTMLSGAFGRAKRDPVRVLLITGGHKFEEAPFQTLMQSLQGITVSEAKHPDAFSMLRAENRASYDVILLYDMREPISEEEQRVFTECLQAGKGLVVWHHAYCSYQGWPEYQEMIGGRYHRKPWTDHAGVAHPASTFQHDVPFRVKVADRKHPVTRGVGDFEILDETYANCRVNPGVHVLLTTDEATSISSVAWTNRYGKSKVVTILLGHDHHAWENPEFVKLLTQAILWAKF